MVMTHEIVRYYYHTVGSSDKSRTKTVWMTRRKAAYSFVKNRLSLFDSPFTVVFLLTLS